jgi:hypothetical protein
MPLPEESVILAEARARAHVSLRDFAETLGVSHQAIAYWERGEQAPNDDRLRAWILGPDPVVRDMALAIVGLRTLRAALGYTLYSNLPSKN